MITHEVDDILQAWWVHMNPSLAQPGTRGGGTTYSADLPVAFRRAPQLICNGPEHAVAIRIHLLDA